MANNKVITATLRLIADVENVKHGAAQIQQVLGKLKLPNTLQTGFEKTFTKLENDLIKFQNQLKSDFKKKGDVTGLENTAKSINLAFDKLYSDLQKIQGLNMSEIGFITPQNLETIKSYNEKIKELRANIEKVFSDSKGDVLPTLDVFDQKSTSKAAANAAGLIRNKIAAEDYAGALEVVNQALAKQRQTLDGLETRRRKNPDLQIDTSRVEANIRNFELVQKAIQDVIQEVQDLQTGINSVENDKAKVLAQNWEELAEKLNLTAEEAEELRQRFRDVGKEGVETGSSLNAMSDDLQSITGQIKSFFGLANGVMLFRKAVSAAVESVKELDATMTEAAVVTEFSVGDMWDKLPEYSEEASKLGATINDLYAATTLYYQQGLKTNEAMGVGIETMKMARIANMDAAEATKAMTAAVRGFNMEINETSAQRVNDVYSELAAITAADTSQIATAMSKTASIAASSNMEFETTAAWLSQIIETTQEAPETAGTALKTIIARFSEVKKLVDQGLFTGEDEEGEVIDVNKIDTALKSVGISMTNFFEGTEGLDSVLLKLAEKWDTLDFSTQRYIATTAAGSRQQSRFIAMMSDYDRTMELVGAANNSAGASVEQFNKTLDSLDSKLKQLENAANVFLMGLANNDIIKFAIDSITGLINALNWLIDSLSFGNSMIKTFMTAFLSIKGFSLGRSFVKMIVGDLGEAWRGEGEKSGKIYVSNVVKTVKKGIINGLKDLPKTISGFFERITIKLPEINMKEVEEGFFDFYDKKEKAIQKKPVSKQGDSETQLYQEMSDEYDKILKASTTQQLAYNAAREAGIPAEQAFKLLTEENTKATIQSITYKQAEIEALAEDKEATEDVIKALAEKKARQIEDNLVERNTLTTRIAIAVQNKILAATETGIGKALNVATGGWLKNNAAMLGSLASYGLIIGAVTLLSALLPAVFEAIANSTPEGQLRLAEEAAREAGEAAEQAAQRYNTLRDSLDSIAGKEDVLDGLVESTREWRDAVQELNNETLNLLNQYPELAAFVKNTNGRLELDYEMETANGETVDSVLKSYQDQQIAATAGHIAAQIDTVRKQQAVDRKEQGPRLNRYEAGQELWSPKEANAIIDQIAKDIALGKLVTTGTDGEQSITDYDALLNYLIDDLGYAAAEATNLADQLQYSTGALREYGQSILQNEAQSDAYYNTLAANAATQANLEGVSTQDQARITNAFNPDRMEDIFNKALTDYEDMSSTEQKALREEYAKARYGNDAEVEGDTIIKADPNNEGEVIKIELEDEEWANEIAGMLSTKEASEQMEALSREMNNVSGETADFIDHLYDTSDGLSLTRDDLALLNKQIQDWGTATNEEIITQLKALGITDEFAEAAGGWDYFINHIKGSLTGSETAFADAGAKIDAKLGRVSDSSGRTFSRVETSDVLRDLSADQLTSLSEQIETLSADNAKAYIEGFENLIRNSNLGESAKEQLENYITKVDWSNMSSAMSAMEYLQNLGLDTGTIETFWDIATDGANTFVSSVQEALSIVDSFQKKLGEIGELETRLSEGTASYEDMMTLVEAGVDISAFQIGPEGWSGTSEEIERATDLMKEHYAERAKKVAEAHREELAAAQNNQADMIWRNEEGSYEVGSGGLGTITSVDDQGQLIAGQVTENTRAAVSQALAAVGYDTTDKNLQELQAIYDKYIQLLNSGENIQIIQDKLAAYTDSLAYTADENVQRGGSDESVRYSVQQEASDLGLDFEGIISYSDTLKERNAELTQSIADRIALDAATMESAVEKITSSWDEWINVLNDSNKDTIAYHSTLKELKAEVNKLIGIQEDLSDEFYTSTENQELMKKAAEGSAEAFNELQKAAIQDGLAQFQTYAEGIPDALQASIDAITSTDLEAGEFAGEELANQLYDVYNQARNAAIVGGYEAAQAMQFANEMMEAAGFEMPRMVEEEYDVTSQIPEGWIPERGGSFEDSTGMTHTGVQWKRHPGGEVTYTATRLVPEAGSKPPAKRVERIGGGGSKKSGGGGGSGGSKEKEPAKQHWENPYDELYNLTEKVNESLRERERLERRYDRLLKDRTATSREIIANSLKEIANLQAEIALQKELQQGRLRQIERLGREDYLATRKITNSEGEEEEEQFWTTFDEEFKRLGLEMKEAYASYNPETGLIQIDWDKIEAIEDNETSGEDQGALIEKYIDKLEELSEQYEDTQEEIEEMHDLIEEIRDRSKQEYLDFEQDIYDAIVAREQRVIDDYQVLSDTLTESADEMLSALRESVDLERQIRDNTKQEEDIADMESRLSYLRADTSNANQLEILRLEEQLADAREAYGDALIDQELDRLNKAQEDAAAQRERQIEIMQAQLDYDTKMGKFWDEVKSLLDGAIGENGALIKNSALVQLLEETEGFQGMSELGKMNWIDELIQRWNQAQEGLSNLMVDKVEQAGSTKGYTVFDESGQNIGELTYKDGKWYDQTGGYYNRLYWDASSKSFRAEGYVPYQEPTAEAPAQPESGPPAQATPEPQETTHIVKQGENLSRIRNYYNALGYNTSVDKIYEDNIDLWRQRGQLGNKNFVHTGWALKIKKYKTGGLVDSTGLAWLDGTKTKPEMVLNAEQTKNFIILKDILSDVLSGVNNSDKSGGDNYYEINIHVDEIGSDYDVDQLTAKIKRELHNDGMYRNVNTIALQR